MDPRRILEVKFLLASSGLGDVVTLGKLSWVDLLYYENLVKKASPELQKQEAEQQEIDKMLKIFENAK